MLTVVLTDDSKAYRDTLKFLLEKNGDIQVVGCAGNGREAAGLCDVLLPDVVLMDIMMDGCDGIEATGIIKKSHREIKVIMLTTFGDDEKISDALKNGADGYVLKDISSKELVLAIKSVAGGMGIVHKNVLKSVARQLNTGYEAPEKQEEGKKFGLSDKELKIISLIVDGKSNKEIAACLFFTEGSIRNVISGILEKLKLSDRTQLAVFAIRNNLV